MCNTVKSSNPISTLLTFDPATQVLKSDLSVLDRPAIKNLSLINKFIFWIRGVFNKNKVVNSIYNLIVKCDYTELVALTTPENLKNRLTLIKTKFLGSDIETISAKNRLKREKALSKISLAIKHIDALVTTQLKTDALSDQTTESSADQFSCHSGAFANLSPDLGDFVPRARAYKMQQQSLESLIKLNEPIVDFDNPKHRKKLVKELITSLIKEEQSEKESKEKLNALVIKMGEFSTLIEEFGLNVFVAALLKIYPNLKTGMLITELEAVEKNAFEMNLLREKLISVLPQKPKVEAFEIDHGSNGQAIPTLKAKATKVKKSITTAACTVGNKLQSGWNLMTESLPGQAH